jgi:16S rRNA (adenine1518-N6/adenine1519-N6)-dimethyltransferase
VHDFFLFHRRRTACGGRTKADLFVSVSRTRRSEPSPRKRFGQHFLRDSGVLADIAAAVSVPEAGHIVEIGPGTGELTAALAEAHPDVPITGVEVDDRMVGFLRKRFRENGDIRIVSGDARDIDLPSVAPPDRPYAVAANLPYFAANPIIRRFLEAAHRPAVMVVMVQREVARELTAPEGSGSLLSVATRIYAETEFLFAVPPTAFDPPPKVWSAVVRLTPHAEPRVPADRIEPFFRLVSRTFRNPRKQLHNALAGGTWLSIEAARDLLDEVGIDASRRPETLTTDEWLHLLAAVEELHEAE